MVAVAVEATLLSHSDGRFTLSVALATADTGRVVWTRQFDAITPDDEPGRTETALVRQIATMGGDVSAFVPPSVAASLKKKFAGEPNTGQLSPDPEFS